MSVQSTASEADRDLAQAGTLASTRAAEKPAKAGLVAGKHGHGPGVPALDIDHQPARTGDHVGAPHLAEVGTDQARPHPQADDRPGPHTPGGRRLGVGQGQVGGDFFDRVRLFGPFPRQGHRGGLGISLKSAPEGPAIGAQRASRRGRKGPGVGHDETFGQRGQKTTSGRSSRPAPTAKRAARLAANRSALARLALAGPAWTSSR